MKATSPLDGKTYYFFDKCIPFGSSRSCALFQAVSDAIAHIVRYATHQELVNYLDDFLFAALIKLVCNGHLNKFLEICAKIKFPVALNKTVFATTVITFLGFLIDTIHKCVSIPVEKVERAKKLIQYVLNKKKVTVKGIQKLCGFLNFLCRVVVPGRAFTRRLYSYTVGFTLKPHHHVLVKKEIRQDLATWL